MGAHAVPSIRSEAVYRVMAKRILLDWMFKGRVSPVRHGRVHVEHMIFGESRAKMIVPLLLSEFSRLNVGHDPVSRSTSRLVKANQIGTVEILHVVHVCLTKTVSL